MAQPRIRKYLSLLGLLLALPLWSQQARLRGRVQDKRDKPLPFANAQLLKASDQSMAAYGISDEKGQFQLRVKPGKYILKISFIGFETQEKKLELRAGPQEQSVEISLLRSSTLLNEVQKTIDLRTVRILGDTLRYRLSAFTDSTEDNLKEALEKLPGFSVSQRGEVSVNGKKVDKVLIDGDNFMSDQSRIALETLPAEAARDIDYIKNYHDSKITHGLASDKTALDIKLQDRYKNRWKGHLRAGAGYKNRGLATLDGYNLNPKFKVYYAGTWNNTGQSPFDFRDYSRMLGGFGSSDNYAATSLQPTPLVSSFEAIESLNQNDAHHIETHFHALNLSLRPNDSLKVKVYGIFGQHFSDRFSHERRTYFEQRGSRVQHFKRYVDTHQRFINTRLATQYSPSENFELRYHFRFNTLYSAGHQRQTQTQRRSEQRNTLRNFIYNTDLILRERFSENTLGSLYGYTQSRRDQLDYHLSTPDGLRLPTGKKTHLLQQQRHTQHAEYGLTPSYTYKAGRVNLSLRSGLRYADEALTLQSTLTDNATSQADLTTRALALEAAIEKNRGKIQYQLLPKITYRRWDYHMSGRQQQAGYFFEPHFNLSYQFRDAHSISLSYQRKNQAYPLKALYPGYITDEISMYKRGGLSPGYSTRDAYGLYYIWVDEISQLNFFADAHYTKARNTLTWRSRLRGGNNFATAALSPQSETFSANLSGSKALSILPLHLHINLGYSLENSNSYAGESLLEIHNKSYNAQIGIDTDFEKGLNLYPGFRYTHNQNARLAPGGTSTFDQYNLSIALRGQIVKNLRIKLSYDYNNYETGYLNQGLQQLGGTLSYKRPGGKLQYYLRMVDVLNLDKSLQVSFSNIALYQQETVSSLLPGYLLLEVKYHF